MWPAAMGDADASTTETEATRKTMLDDEVSATRGKKVSPRVVGRV